MFSHLLCNDDIFLEVAFSEYAKKHFTKRFQKDYSKKQWLVTEESIKQDLGRIKTSLSILQKTQQVDELWQNSNYWIFKYDFRVAGTKVSTKASGNRCIVFLDNIRNKIEILLIYGKGDLPKNMGEQVYIEQVVKENFNDYYKLATGKG